MKNKMMSLGLAMMLVGHAHAKTRIAVSALEDKSGDSRCNVRWYGNNLGSGFKDQMITALIKAGHYEVQERENLQKMYAEEHQLINADSRSLPQKNKFKAAHYSIVGAVTAFEWCASDVGGNLNVGKLIGLDTSSLRVGANRQTAKVGMDIRVVDVESGSVLNSFSTEGNASSTKLRATGDIKGADFGTDAFFASPLGKATREAIEKAVEQIAQVVPKDRQDPKAAARSESEKPGPAAEEQAARRRSSKTAVPDYEDSEAPLARAASTESGHICQDKTTWSDYSMCKILNKSKSGQRYRVLYLFDGDERLVNAKNIGMLARLKGAPRISQKVLVNSKALYWYEHSEKRFSQCKVLDADDEQAAVICGSKEVSIPASDLYVFKPLTR